MPNRPLAVRYEDDFSLLAGRWERASSWTVRQSVSQIDEVAALARDRIAEARRELTAIDPDDVHPQALRAARALRTVAAAARPASRRASRHARMGTTSLRHPTRRSLAMRLPRSGSGSSGAGRAALCR